MADIIHTSGWLKQAVSIRLAVDEEVSRELNCIGVDELFLFKRS
jgi:hypothetical protein